MLHNKIFLVTGGAGFTGSHLVDKLVTLNPEKIVVVDNFFLGKVENLENAMRNYKNLIVYREDASSYSFMENIIEKEGVDVIFDLAVKPLPYSFVNPEGAFMTSVKIANVLVNLLRRDAYKTLIHISSSEAYGTAKYVPMDEKHPLDPTTPYSAGKAAADLLLMSYYNMFNLDISIVRPFNIYGPRQNCELYAAVIPISIQKILAGEKPILEGSGKQTRDFTYISDVVDAMTEVYRNPNTRGKIINIGSGKEVEILWLINLIMKLTKYHGEIVYKPQRTADLQQHIADISLAKKIVNYKPKTDFETGLKKTIEWYKKLSPRITSLS